MRTIIATMIHACLLLATPAFADQIIPEPPASSVLFSTRWERPEARTVATQFHATDFVWLYPKTRAYLAELKAGGFQIGTTLNANQAVVEEGLARDLEYRPLIAPWMKSWGARWISIASPATRTALLSAAKRQADWGATSIQFDDPALATASFNWGGDFSDAAIDGFSQWLAKNGGDLFPDLPAETRSGQFNYRAWLATKGITTNEAYLAKRSKLPINPAWERYHQETVRDFFSDLRKQLHGMNPPRALNLNLTNPRPDARTFNLIDLADGIMSETSASDPANTALGVVTVQGVGGSYQPSLQPHDVNATRRQIALFYSLGALPLVPWDVYMPDSIGPNKERQTQPRYFGTAAEYADLYQLVRTQPALFDQQRPMEGVLLLCQVEHFKAAEVLEIIRALQARHIPFALAVARGTYPARLFDPALLERAPAIILASKLDGIDPASQTALNRAAAKQINWQALDQHKHRLAPLLVESTVPVLVMPRRTPGQSKELIVHLVQSGDSPTGKVKLELNPAIFSGRKIASAEKFSPAQARAQKLAVTSSSIELNMQEEWQILRLVLQP